ncbi:hypothetical protein ACFLY8_01970 [Halobacteriota archaeon]
MNIGRREFLKYIAFAGAIATMGFSGCVSTPEPTPNPVPTPIPTPKPSASEPTPTSTPITINGYYVGTETKICPLCGSTMYLIYYNGLKWFCEQDAYCGHSELVTEPEILRKYGYTD